MVEVKNIAILLDTENMIRENEFGFGITDIENALIKQYCIPILRKEFLDKKEEELQDLVDTYFPRKIKEAFISKYAKDKLIEYIAHSGFHPMQGGIGTDNSLAVRAVELGCSPRYNHIDTIAIVSRDADFAPAIYLIREYNKETIVIGAPVAFSDALKNAADYSITLECSKKGNLGEAIDKSL